MNDNVMIYFFIKLYFMVFSVMCSTDEKKISLFS